MSWTELVKNFVGLDVIFGVRTKKLGGINDADCIITTDVVTDNADNSITFTGNDMPIWLIKERYFRFVGGANDGSLFRVKEIISSNKITIYEVLVSDTGNYTIDARLWRVHFDNTISRKSPSGGTMFNLDNLDDTGVPEDGSCLAKNVVVHYHDDDPWKVNVHPIGEKNNLNLIYVIPDSETFIYGKLEVYLSGNHLNGDQDDPERDFSYLPDRSGFQIIIDPEKWWRLNSPPLKYESLEITYLQHLE